MKYEINCKIGKITFNSEPYKENFDNLTRYGHGEETKFDGADINFKAECTAEEFVSLMGAIGSTVMPMIQAAREMFSSCSAAAPAETKAEESIATEAAPETV